MTEVVLQDQLLECVICFEKLDETCKMLPCQHTYCKLCLENMYQHEGSLCCPQCRKVVPNTEGNPIDALPTNFVLLNIIEQVKRNPPARPRTEDDEIETAITISLEDFQKEKATNLLLRHNEQLQTRLALESSRRDALLKTAQEMSNQYAELLQHRRSQDEEAFRKKNEDLLSEKEKLEFEIAILKSEQETVTNPDDIIDMISWFETHCANFNEEQKSGARVAVKNLRRAKVVQHNQSVQVRLRDLLRNLKPPEVIDSSDKSHKTNDTKDLSSGADASPDNDVVVDEIVKKIKEMKVVLRQENEKKQSKLKANCTNQTSNHVSPLMPGYYQPPSSHFYGLPQYPYFYPPGYFPLPEQLPMNYVPALQTKSPVSRGKPPFHGRGERHGREAGPRAPYNSKPLNALMSDRKDITDRSLILPDLRDYDRIDKKLGKVSGLQSGHISQQKHCGKSQKGTSSLPSSSGAKSGPLLMLPDIRHYEEVYQKFPHRPDTSGNMKSDTESFGMCYKKETKPFRGNQKIEPRGGFTNWRIRHYDNSNKKPNEDGFESDTSVNSATSSSSKLSTFSAAGGYRGKKRFSNRGNYRGSNRYSQGKPREVYSKYDSDINEIPYPSKEEAEKRKLNVEKRFDSPVMCLGKNGNEPVSMKAECLADIYKFEAMYKKCKLIRF